MKWIILTLLFFLIIFITSQPVYDPDIFWHLRTGEWICENKGLPETDPFSFTTSPYAYKRLWAPFILKQYWLSEIILYGIWGLFGIWGIVGLRVLIFLSITSILYIYMRRRAVGIYSSIFFLIPVLITFHNYTADRPVLISYLMAVVVFFLIEEMRVKERVHLSYIVLLPLVMPLWANMHGGFMLGIMIIGIYLIAEIIDIARGKRRPSYLLLILPFSSLLSFLNPNLYKAFPSMLEVERGLASKAVTEFKGPIYFASELNLYFFIVILAVVVSLYILSVIANLIRKKGVEISHIPLFLFLTALSLTSKRYIPFLVFIVMPIIAEGLSGLTDRVLKRVEKGAMAFILIAILFISSDIFPKTVFKMPPLSQGYFFPIDAVDFIKGNNIKGNIFNNYEWGGYLMWELRANGIFIDTRGIDYGMVEAYGRVEGCSRNLIMGIPQWKAILDAYRIDLVFMPSVNIVGSMPALIPCLVSDKEWRLIYKDPIAFIFIRDSGRSRSLIERYSMPKETVYGVVRDTAYSCLKTNPSNPLLWITVGRANLGLGMPEQALMAFEKAIGLNPDLEGDIGPVVSALKLGSPVRVW